MTLHEISVLPELTRSLLIVLLLTVVSSCAETPALPPDSPGNPASENAPEAESPAPSVLGQALPPPVPIQGVAPAVDHSHHHHHEQSPAAGAPDAGADAAPGPQ